MKRWIQTLCVVLATASCLSATTACPGKRQPGITPIAFVSGIADQESLSTVFAYKLREALVRSSSYCLVDAEHDADFTFSISAIDLPLSGSASSIAVYESTGRVFLNHWVQGCGEKKVDQCVDIVIARFDVLLREYRTK